MWWSWWWWCVHTWNGGVPICESSHPGFLLSCNGGQRMLKVVANRWMYFLRYCCPSNVVCLFLWFVKRKPEPFVCCCRSDAQMLRGRVSQLGGGSQLLILEPCPSPSQPPSAESSGWSCCPLEAWELPHLGTQSQSHRWTPHFLGSMCLSCCQKLNVVLMHFCACVRIHFPGLLMEGTHPVFMIESQLKIQRQGFFWNVHWWFLFSSPPQLGHQPFNLLPGGKRV